MQKFLGNLIMISMIIIMQNTELFTQTQAPELVTFAERNMAGPRLGVTYRLGKLTSDELGHIISQFGWHFEHLVIPDGGGPSFVVQFTPMLAGVEHAMLIPTATLALGVRMPNGIEFGMGPNILMEEKKIINTALVVAIGKSFNYGGVSIPIDIAWTTNPDYNRVSLIIGYAIQKSSK